MRIEETCETCVHERDSGHEYCGSCDLVSQWKAKPELVAEMKNDEIEGFKLEIARLEDENAELRRVINKLKDDER